MFKREGPFSYSFDVMHFLSKKDILAGQNLGLIVFWVNCGLMVQGLIQNSRTVNLCQNCVGYVCRHRLACDTITYKRFERISSGKYRLFSFYFKDFFPLALP